MKIAERFEHFEGYERNEEKGGIRLDKNESPFDLPKHLKEEVFDELKRVPLNRYPPQDPYVLREKIAKYIGYSRENIAVGNGSDALLPVIFELFDKDQIVINSPTFSMYSFYAKRKDMTLNKVPLNDEFQMVDIADMVEEPSIICICSPNSPTGNDQSRDKIENLLETDNLVLLDEAYAEFCSDPNLDLMEDYNNLIILRTLSKAFGLAALRVGYAVGSADIIDHLNRIKSPYNMDIPSMKIAEKVLDHPEIVENNVDKIINERRRLIDEFKKYAYPSQSNFVLLDLDAHGYLKERGIHVRKMKGRLQGMIRVTIGKKKENDRLISALNDFVEEKKG